MTEQDPRLLVVHVVYRFDVGGLENGVVNLVNHLPAQRFRHAIVALTEVTDFRHRITRDDVRYISLHKPPGHGMRQWPALVRTFREMRPDIVHTRNLAPLEAMVPAWLAGVPARVHGEHGWDVSDLNGSNRRHRLTRRLYRPFVTRYVALSRHIQDYLESSVGVPADAIAQIYNGVDTVHYSRTVGTRATIIGSPFNESSAWLIGTVGRLAAVKDQAGLIRAVAAACGASAEAGARLRLVIVGDGPLMSELKEVARAEGVTDRTWFAGSRDDVAQVLAGLDAFALPSLAEGISNTLLEAMATGLPVIATRVGGNTELVTHDVSGVLVPSANSAALTDAMLGYLTNPALARRHGMAARATVEARYSLDRMVVDYAALYDSVAHRRVSQDAPSPTSTRPAQARGNN
jgi:sugar transferase (PEP-CTERM/EpsH1 system associated)